MNDLALASPLKVFVRDGLLRRRIPAFLLAMLLLFPATTVHTDDSIDWRDGLVLQGFQGNELRGETLQGQPLLLQFWASWCRSCGKLMADMEETASRFTAVKYLAVSIDEEFAVARKRIEAHPLFLENTQNFFHDSGQRVAGYFDVNTVPTVIVVGGDGREIFRHRGHFNSSDLHDLVTRLTEIEASSAGNSP